MKLFHTRPDGAFQAYNATVVGKVTVGAETSFWFNVTVRGDVAPITIGQRVNIQDNSVIHVDNDIENVIEDEVVIGHGAVIHGAAIGKRTLIGMGATILGKTKIGAGCLIAAGCVVPPGLVVPDNHMVIGVPGKIAREVKPAEQDYIAYLYNHYVELAKEYVRGDYDSQVFAK